MYKLNEKVRLELKKPLGRLIPAGKEGEFLSKELKGKTIIAVGDRTTENCLSYGLKPKVEIVDMREKREERKETPSGAKVTVRVKNEAGTISEEAVEAIKRAIKDKESVRIEVEGEEDLLGLPAILYAPDGWYVLYGQPNEGLVAVEVNEKSKALAEKFLEMMKEE